MCLFRCLLHVDSSRTPLRLGSPEARFCPGHFGHRRIRLRYFLPHWSSMLRYCPLTRCLIRRLESAPALPHSRFHRFPSRHPPAPLIHPSLARFPLSRIVLAAIRPILPVRCPVGFPDPGFDHPKRSIWMIHCPAAAVKYAPAHWKSQSDWLQAVCYPWPRQTPKPFPLPSNSSLAEQTVLICDARHATVLPHVCFARVNQF